MKSLYRVLLIFILMCALTVWHAPTEHAVRAQPARPDEPQYRLGFIQAPNAVNPLALYGSTGATLWNHAATGGWHLSLAGPVGPRGDLLPILASTLTPQHRMKREQHPQSTRTYVTATLPLRRDIAWSDGSLLRAADVVFTYQILAELNIRSLGGNWPILYPEELVHRVELVDAHTVKFWLQRQPGLGEWQYGLMAVPILQKSVWEKPVQEALKTLNPALSAAQLEVPFNVLGPIQPSFPSGPALPWHLLPNPRDVRAFEKVVLFESGHAALTNPLSQFEYRPGGIGGDVAGTIVSTPPPSALSIHPFESRGAVKRALREGEIDAWLDPLAMQQYPDAQGVRALAFNLDRAPIAVPALRAAVRELINRQELIERIPDEYVVRPSHSLVPPSHTRWYNPSMDRLQSVSSEGARLERAREILQDAGFTWAEKTLTGPDGWSVGPFTIVTPAADYDPIAHAAAQYAGQLLHMLGIEAQVRTEDFAGFIDRVVRRRDFDLAVIGMRQDSSGFPHPLALLFGPTSPAPGAIADWNVTGYRGTEFTLGLRQLLRATEVEAARRAAFTLQEILHRDAPIIPLVHVGQWVPGEGQAHLEWLWPDLSPRHSTVWLE